MKMQEIIAYGKRWGVPYKIGLSKMDMIRAIQKNEGYTPCFRRDDCCEQTDCLWMEDCKPAKQKSLLPK